MNNLIYEYVPSENIAKVSINDFETLLAIKDNYEKLIRRVPNNVLQQRIDKAIEYCEEIKSRAIDIDDTDFDLGEDFTARRLLNILKGSEDNEKN